MIRLLRVTAIVLLVLAAALYLGDWAVFLLRGSPVDKVTVSLFVNAPLKNNKIESDYLGQEQWSCTKTLFPLPPFAKDTSSPCWYLQKHTNQVTTY